MALRTRGIITQIAKESTFAVAPDFSDDDVVVVEKATINPKVDMVDRKVMSCSQIKQGGVPVRFTTDGDISLEIDGKDGANDFYGKILFEAGLGFRDEPSDKGHGCFIGHDGNDDNDPAVDKVVKADSDHQGEATLYTVADGLQRISLAIKKFYDSGDVVLLSLGNVINKVSLDFKQADILTASFTLEGAKYDTLSGQTKPACTKTSDVPFVGKNAVFKFYGNSVAAKDLTINITNTITNIEAITTEGYSDKVIVEKQIEGQFTALLEDFSYLDKLTNQTIGEFYLEIESGDKKLGVYMPRIKVSQVSVTDDSGKLIEVQISFIAEKDGSVGEALLLGIKS